MSGAGDAGARPGDRAGYGTDVLGIGARLCDAEPVESRPLDELVARLRERFGRVAVLPAAVDRTPRAAEPPPIRGISADSRSVMPGNLFVAIPGAVADGHRYAADAELAGAAAILVERAIDGLGIRQVVVPQARPALAEVAAWWYGDPSRDLGVIGITGTDGKTTTSLLASAALRAAGLPSGLIGTVATLIGGSSEANPEHSTTPEAPALQRALRAMVQAGDRAAIIETTSHGLAMDRVAAIGYDIAVMTNVTHEHLELHGSFDAYRAAKISLFERLATSALNPLKPLVGWPRAGIVNVDDPSAGLFIGATRTAGAAVVTYGQGRDASVRLLEVRDDAAGQVVAYRLSGLERTVLLQLQGRFNASNALAVVAIGAALQLNPESIEAGLSGVAGVPGRMERVVAGQPFEVIVDYAHSPASLTAVLDELGPRAIERGGGLIVAFGSAGERDIEKRPIMGRVAAERCRVVVLTDEDPRGEDRGAILAAIAAGARTAARPDPATVLQIADRRAAIREAFGRARPGDIVLLAGKGHETTILYADHALPWDEAMEARVALAELGFAG